MRHAKAIGEETHRLNLEELAVHFNWLVQLKIDQKKSKTQVVIMDMSECDTVKIYRTFEE